MSICVVVNSLFLIGLLKFLIENNVEVLYILSNSQVYKDREFFKNVYLDLMMSNFELYQFEIFGRYVDVMMIFKNKLDIMN